MSDEEDRPEIERYLGVIKAALDGRLERSDHPDFTEAQWSALGRPLEDLAAWSEARTVTAMEAMKGVITGTVVKNPHLGWRTSPQGPSRDAMRAIWPSLEPRLDHLWEWWQPHKEAMDRAEAEELMRPRDE